MKQYGTLIVLICFVMLLRGKTTNNLFRIYFVNLIIILKLFYPFQQQIEAALDKVCSLLPATVQQECDNYVKDYTPVLINLLTKMSPDQICTYLKFCTNSTTASKGKITAHKDLKLCFVYALHVSMCQSMSCMFIKDLNSAKSFVFLQ